MLLITRKVAREIYRIHVGKNVKFGKINLNCNLFQHHKMKSMSLQTLRKATPMVFVTLSIARSPHIAQDDLCEVESTYIDTLTDMSVSFDQSVEMEVRNDSVEVESISIEEDNCIRENFSWKGEDREIDPEPTNGHGALDVDKSRN